MPSTDIYDAGGRSGWPGRLWALLDPVSALSHLYRHRELTMQLVWRDVAQRYRGSHLGFLWSLVTPLATLAIYTFVFSTVLKARWRPQAETSSAEFALALFAGLIPFGVFSEVANRCAGIVVSTPNYVKKVIFPLDILPVIVLGSALIHSFIGVAILSVGVLWLTGDVAPLCMAALPLAYAPLVFLCLAVGWTLASMGVYFRDIGHGVGIVVQMLMFLSPIVYPIQAVPVEFQQAMWLNPLTTVVEVFRSLLLWHSWPDWRPWLAWTVVTAALAWLSHGWFVYLRKGFADVL